MRTVTSLTRCRMGIWLLALVIFGAASGNTYAGKENDWTHEHRADGSQEYGHSTGHWQSDYGRHAQYHRTHKGSVHANTKISPTKGKPNQPFTIIDGSGRRLVPESVAIFRLGDIEFEIPLKTHWPFNTARGRLADGMYNGLYAVSVRQPSGAEFSIGDFKLYGGDEGPTSISYGFSNTVYAEGTIGSDGGSISLIDSFGAQFDLSVPPNALSTDTDIALTQVESITNFPQGFNVLTAVRLTPSGQQFGPSPELVLAPPSGSRNGRPAFGFVTNDDGSELVFIPLSGTSPADAALLDPSVRMFVNHFSVAGVAEADDCSSFPPPPVNANAEERTLTTISVLICQILEAGGDFPSEANTGIFDALLDWFSNPQDGLDVRLLAAAQSPDTLTYDLVDDLVNEANRLLLEAYEVLPEEQSDVFDAAVLESVKVLTEAYFTQLRNVDCSMDTPSAERTLDEFEIFIIGQFVNGDLQDAFENKEEEFQCQYEVVFSKPFQAAFIVDEFADIPYTITQQDGNQFDGSLADLENEYKINIWSTHVDNGTILALSPDILLASVNIVTSKFTIQFEENSPVYSAEVLWLPSFLGDYFLIGSGTASGCTDPGDEGDGGGVTQVSVSDQQITFATPDSAIIEFNISGWNLTSATATVTLDTIEPGNATEPGKATGSVSGSLSYFYQEYDPEDMRSYPVSGGGTFTGTVTATSTGQTMFLSYSGTSNWCTSYSGNGIMEGP